MRGFTLLQVSCLGALAWGCQADDVNIADYYELPARVRDANSGVSPADVMPSANEGALQRAVVRRLRLAPMLAGFDQRPLEFSVVATRTFPEFIEQDLLFTDPLVGTLEATYVLPRTPPRGAVVGLHGHQQERVAFVRDHLGHELARGGLAVLVPTLRAMGCERQESDVALYLEQHRLSLMGVRVYEAMLMLKHIADRPEIPKGHVALMGHSGGSSASVLVGRLRPDIAALVTDYAVNFVDVCADQQQRPLAHCETLPALYPVRSLIHDPATVGFPWLKVPYGYGDNLQRAEIVRFLQDHI